MNEELKTILTLVIAIIGVPTAIFGFAKAYIELKRVILDRKKKRSQESEGNAMNSAHNEVSTNHSSLDGNITNTTGSNNSTTVINHMVVNNSAAPEQASSQKDIVSPDSENILLKDKYTSLFAENGEIHSEVITIQNLGGGKVEGSVYLDDNYTYKLTGTFKNRILTGEFTSIGKFTDERGTINLKLISEDILSGFCTFSKISMTAEDQIRMSPYVWMAGESSDLINGTYAFCTRCHNEGRKCCCASPDVDMPVLLQNEAKKLQAINPRTHKMNAFSRAIGNAPIRQMHSLSNSSNATYCHFYDPNRNKCTIYDIRPTDCRLFPFDIKLDNNTNEYWVGYYSDLCEELPDEETMRLYAHILRPQLFLLFPYANIINKSEVCEHLSKASFEKLYRLQQIVF